MCGGNQPRCYHIMTEQSQNKTGYIPFKAEPSRPTATHISTAAHTEPSFHARGRTLRSNAPQDTRSHAGRNGADYPSVLRDRSKEGDEANGGDERNPVRFSRTATSSKPSPLTAAP
jgi:hypothetical protein